MELVDKASGINSQAKSARQRQIEYLKLVRFNGFANQSASLIVNRAGIVSGIQNSNTDAQEVLKETEIIRDLLYVFQGIHGTHI